MIEDGRVQKARQNRFCYRGLTGLAADALPNGIPILHLLDAVALGGCHWFCPVPREGLIAGGRRLALYPVLS